MESLFCVDCLEEAFRNYGIPEIFNSEQGSQFTSDVFIKALMKHPTLRISMDSKGVLSEERAPLRPAEHKQKTPDFTGVFGRVEVKSGFEPLYEVLQTSA
jgi:hypothetical protein